MAEEIVWIVTEVADDDVTFLAPYIYRNLEEARMVAEQIANNYINDAEQMAKDYTNEPQNIRTEWEQVGDAHILRIFYGDLGLAEYISVVPRPLR